MKIIRSKALRLLSVCFIVLVFLSASGCGRKKLVSVDVKEQEHDFNLTPCKKENGDGFTIAFMDLGPPIESSYLCLKGFAEGLQSIGYIREDVDLSGLPSDFFAYYKALANESLGGYVRFCESPYMIDEEGNEGIAEELKKKCGEGQIDVIVATGTAPGVFLKSLDLPVPVLVCLATDPVASGIIASAEDTGDPDIWALVEPNPYKRQFEGYKKVIGFDRICLVTVNGMDTITGNPLYREAAKELGVEVQEINFEAADMRADNYDEMIAERLHNTDFSGVDAVLFAYGTMDDKSAPMLSAMMARRGIPSLVGDGDSICEHGAMMCLSCFDYEGYGEYASMVLSNVLHGEKAGDQPCMYSSAPHIVLNIRTAQNTNYACTYDLLYGVDKIYR